MYLFNTPSALQRESDSTSFLISIYHRHRIATVLQARSNTPRSVFRRL